MTGDDERAEVMSTPPPDQRRSLSAGVRAVADMLETIERAGFDGAQAVHVLAQAYVAACALAGMSADMMSTIIHMQIDAWLATAPRCSLCGYSGGAELERRGAAPPTCINLGACSERRRAGDDTQRDLAAARQAFHAAGGMDPPPPAPPPTAAWYWRGAALLWRERALDNHPPRKGWNPR